MVITIADVMAECKNHFQDANTPYIDGDFVIAEGILSPNTGLAEGDYIAITGSRLNDGVYLPTVAAGEFSLGEDASAEAFTGRVWVLHPPRKFVALVAEITSYAAANAPSALTSESFGGTYSWSKAVGSNGAPISWPVVYADQLRPYRRMFKVVSL